MPGCVKVLAEILLQEQEKIQQPKEMAVKSLPAHQCSHSSDSLVKKVIHVSVGTDWAEVVWHAKISVNNCLPSHLPEP